MIAESIVTSVDSEYSSQTSKVTCNMPVIQNIYEQGIVTLSIVLVRTPLIAIIPETTIQITENMH